MNDLIFILQKCKIFKGLSERELEDILKNVSYTIYDKCKNCAQCKSCILNFEGDNCSKLSIVLEGTVDIQKHYSNGKIVSINTLTAGNTFGEAIIFSNENTYPATIVAYRGAKVLYISKDDILSLLNNKKILNNFMNLLSSKILTLNKKVTLLSFESLRQKICYFILSEYKKQNTLSLHLPMSKKALSEYLGVQRPSLSRELINMKNDNLIDFDRSTIKIIDLEHISSLISY